MFKTGEFNFFLQFKFGNCGLFPQFSTTLLKRLKKGEMSLIFTDKKDRPPARPPTARPPTRPTTHSPNNSPAQQTHQPDHPPAQPPTRPTNPPARPNFKSVVHFLLEDFRWWVSILGMMGDHPVDVG